VKQGLIQTLGVFTDTLYICSCTAFIILFGGVPDASLNGIQLTQAALESEIGPAGGVFVAVAIFLFAFSRLSAIITTAKPTSASSLRGRGR